MISPRYAALALAALFAIPASAATFYVRTDGGTSAQCDGTANVAVSPSRHCAWISPMVAFPGSSYGSNAPSLINPGDTLRIADGSYRIGIGAPGSEACSTSAAFDCEMSPPPDNVHIIGNVEHPDLVELWGTQGVHAVVNLESANGIELAGMQITDHSACIRDYPDSAVACKNTYLPTGNDWAIYGIVGHDNHDLSLHDVNIHGVAGEGLRVGRLTNATVRNVQIIGNAFAGWDFDVGQTNGQDSSNAGLLSFDHVEIAWNGCGESYPQRNVFDHCWAQNNGGGGWNGYGDGFAAGHTGGNWTFNAVHFHHNASDGLDLLYGRGTNTNPASITVTASQFDGNAGNQVKLRGRFVSLSDSVVNGNCAQAFAIAPPNNAMSPPYASKYPYMQLGSTCRAGGDAVALSFVDGAQFTVDHVTITGQSEGLLVSSQTGGSDDPGGSNGATLTVRNSIISGNNQLSWIMAANHADPTGIAGEYSYETNPAKSFSNVILWGTTDAAQTRAGVRNVDPKFANPSPIAFDPHLLPGSPAIGAGTDGQNVGALTLAGTPPVVVPPQPSILCAKWHWATATTALARNAAAKAAIWCDAPYKVQP